MTYFPDNLPQQVGERAHGNCEYYLLNDHGEMLYPPCGPILSGCDATGSALDPVMLLSRQWFEFMNHRNLLGRVTVLISRNFGQAREEREMLPLTTISTLIICVTILTPYVLVRVPLVRFPFALIVGFTINPLAFFMFAIAPENNFTLAVIVAFSLGAIFTVTSVAMGVFLGGDASQPVAGDLYPLSVQPTSS